MDKQNLSKIKYIYRIYKSAEDNQVHIEKYPVVYVNSNYTYYKVANKQELQWVGTPKVYETAKAACYELSKITRYWNLSFYFWDLDGFDIENSKYIENLRREALKQKYESDLKQHKSLATRYKNHYDGEMEEIEKLEKKLAGLESEEI